MLDTRFPRPMGDLGNPASWGVPTELLVVQGIGPADAVQSAQQLRQGPVLRAFCEAVVELKRRGVAAITTSCGFLAPLQRDLQRAASIRAVTSSLTLLPSLLAEGLPVGVLTINSQRLGADHFLALGISHAQLGRLVVEGMPAGGRFSRSILGNRKDLDIEGAGDEVVAAALRLKARAPAVRTLVLECTNMPPYAQRIRQATGFRVLSLLDSPLLRAALAVDQLAACRAPIA
ncbi:hypothetical protein [Caenimonas sp. SL110]|uniref:hypothetical protein n=1 Tax=Caenimonas sp. SL110 TaxID=1450524 RepID=UPI000653ED2D|nr:hypothetical protein [Caenimonas sp. SL110]